jgi:hypothetical protein
MSGGTLTLSPERARSSRVAYWTKQIADMAPGAPWILVRPFVHLLASCADTDALLLAADALEEAAKEALMSDGTPKAFVLYPRAVAAVLREEAPRRS